LTLIGWNALSLDLGPGHRLWIFADHEDSGAYKAPSGRLEAEFSNIGYGALLLCMAVLFLVPGGWVMHGTGRSFSLVVPGAVFAHSN